MWYFMYYYPTKNAGPAPPLSLTFLVLPSHLPSFFSSCLPTSLPSCLPSFPSFFLSLFSIFVSLCQLSGDGESIFSSSLNFSYSLSNLILRTSGKIFISETDFYSFRSSLLPSLSLCFSLNTSIYDALTSLSSISLISVLFRSDSIDTVFSCSWVMLFCYFASSNF